MPVRSRPRFGRSVYEAEILIPRVTCGRAGRETSSAAGVSDALAMGGASLLFGSFVTDGAQEKDLRDSARLRLM